MKIIEFRIQVAVTDFASEDDILIAVEKAANEADGVLAADLSTNFGLDVPKAITEGTGSPAKMKRKYTRRKPLPPREKHGVNAQNEKVTRRVNGDGDVIETRT